MEESKVKEAVEKYTKDLKEATDRLNQNRQGQNALRQQEAGLLKALDQINGAIFALNSLSAPEAKPEEEKSQPEEGESEDAKKEETEGA